MKVDDGCMCLCAPKAMDAVAEAVCDVAFVVGSFVFLVLMLFRAYAEAVRVKEVLSRMPKFPELYEDAYRDGRYDACANVCCICLEPINNREECEVAGVALTCEHDAFHGACLQEWLSEHASCPLCRAPAT